MPVPVRAIKNSRGSFGIHAEKFANAVVFLDPITKPFQGWTRPGRMLIPAASLTGLRCRHRSFWTTHRRPANGGCRPGEALEIENTRGFSSRARRAFCRTLCIDHLLLAGLLFGGFVIVGFGPRGKSVEERLGGDDCRFFLGYGDAHDANVGIFRECDRFCIGR